jgi:hypothetical protein
MKEDEHDKKLFKKVDAMALEAYEAYSSQPGG